MRSTGRTAVRPYIRIHKLISATNAGFMRPVGSPAPEKYFFTFFEEKKNTGDKLCRFVLQLTERPHLGGSHVTIF